MKRKTPIAEETKSGWCAGSNKLRLGFLGGYGWLGGVASIHGHQRKKGPGMAGIVRGAHVTVTPMPRA